MASPGSVAGRQPASLQTVEAAGASRSPRMPRFRRSLDPGVVAFRLGYRCPDDILAASASRPGAGRVTTVSG